MCIRDRSTTDVKDNFLFWLYNWDLYFLKSLTNSIKIGKSILQGLINDNFYTIIATYKNTWIELQIKDKNWNIINKNSNTSNYVNINNWILYIWSDYNKQNQWNDIIDYLKIYKE